MLPVRLVVLTALVACGPIPSEPGVVAPAPAPATPPSWQRLVASRDLDGRLVGEAPGRATIAIVFASWCGHCRAEIAELARVQGRDDVRVVGVNFRHHEEYDARGDSAAVRAYLAAEAPWLVAVPGDVDLWRAFGSPSKVPSLYVFDDRGALRAVYDRAERPPPGAAELSALLDQI